MNSKITNLDGKLKLNINFKPEQLLMGATIILAATALVTILRTLLMPRSFILRLGYDIATVLLVGFILLGFKFALKAIELEELNIT